MTQLSLIVNSMPRDLTEFAFFLAVGFTAGSMGLIWIKFKRLSNHSLKILVKLEMLLNIFQFIRLKVLIRRKIES